MNQGGPYSGLPFFQLQLRLVAAGRGDTGRAFQGPGLKGLSGNVTQAGRAKGEVTARQALEPGARSQKAATETHSKPTRSARARFPRRLGRTHLRILPSVATDMTEWHDASLAKLYLSSSRGVLHNHSSRDRSEFSLLCQDIARERPSPLPMRGKPHQGHNFNNLLGAYFIHSHSAA